MVHIEAVRAGVGIGVLHKLIGEADPNLVCLDVPFPFDPLECWLVMHEDVRGNPAVRLVYDALERQLEAYLTGAFVPGRGAAS
jgi:DNA-binding transcriptional LysR family regulator